MKKYAAKHPANAKADEKIVGALQEVLKDEKVSCAAAMLVVNRSKVPFLEVGMAIDLLEYSIVDCQLGIFGEGVKTIHAAASVAPEVEEAIRASLFEGKLACVAAWELAKKLKLSLGEIGQACEALKIKIKPCQLGAF